MRRPARSAPLPPLKSLLYALTIALGLYWCLLRMIKRPVIAALLALALVLVGAWALATARYPTAFMLQRLAILALWSVLLLLALERLLPWGFAKAGRSAQPLAAACAAAGVLRRLLDQGRRNAVPLLHRHRSAQAAIMGAADLERPVLAVLWHR